MFDERESRRITNYSKESLEKSKTGKRTSRNIKGRSKVRILPILMSGVIFVTGFEVGKNMPDFGSNKVTSFADAVTTTIGADKYFSVYKIDDELFIDNMNEKIGSLVFKEEDNEKFNTNEVSILAQCTWGKHDGSNYIYGYNHANIAEKILSLPEEIQDYAIFGVINDMGVTKDNTFDSTNKTNGDYVIELLNKFAESESEKEAYEGMTTILDYMVNHGYVNKEGAPSMNKWWENCDKNAEIIKAQVEKELENRGLNK